MMKNIDLAKLSEKRWLAIAIIFFIFILAAALFPFLFGNKIFINVDATLYYYPIFDFYSNALKSHESFLWNPAIFSGFPTYLSQSAGFFDPLNILLFRFLDSFDAYHFRLFIDLFLVLFFSYLASRTMQISRLASLLTGPAFLAAFNWGYISNLVITNSLFLIPFLVWIAIHMSQSHRKYLWACFGGLGIGWSLLSGYAQFTIYTTTLFGAIFIADILFVQKKYSVKHLSGAFGLLVLAVIVGGVVALPQLLPALDFTSLTVRANGLAYDLTTAKVINPGDGILFLFPDYLYFPYLSAGRRPLYIGALMFFCAIIGSSVLIRRIREKEIPLIASEKRMLIIFGLFLFCFFTAIAHSPIFYLLNKLPVFSYFRFPYRWMYVGVWFLAVIGAYGFDYVRKNSSLVWLKRFTSMLLVIGSAFSAVVFAINFFGVWFWSRIENAAHSILSIFVYGKFGLYKDPAHYRDALSRGIGAWRESLALTKLDFFIPFLIFICGILLIFLVVHNYISQKKFTITGFLLSAVTLPLIFMVQWQDTLPVAVIKNHAAILNQLPKIDTENYRSFPFMIGSGFAKYVPPQYTLSLADRRALGDLQFTSGWPNLNQYAAISSIDGYDPFVSLDLLRILELIGSSHGGEDVTRKLSPLERERALMNNLNLLSLMSGKYIISGIPLSHEDLWKIGEPTVTRYEMPIYIYENLKALPKIYFASQVINIEDQSAEEWMAGTLDFQKTTHIKCKSCKNYPPNSTDTLALTRKKNGIMQIRTHTQGSRWLVVGESYLPGWRVVIDGSDVLPIKANSIYMAIEVPSGDHDITLTYAGLRNELRWLKFLGLVRD